MEHHLQLGQIILKFKNSQINGDKITVIRDGNGTWTCSGTGAENILPKNCATDASIPDA